MFDAGIRSEGRAARKMGLPVTLNPYRKAAEGADESILWEQAWEWDNGWHITTPLLTMTAREEKP